MGIDFMQEWMDYTSYNQIISTLKIQPDQIGILDERDAHGILYTRYIR